MPRKLSKRESQGIKKDKQIWHNKQIRDENLLREKIRPQRYSCYDRVSFVIRAKCASCSDERREACYVLGKCIKKEMDKLHTP
jgi:hypothetical protein